MPKLSLHPRPVLFVGKSNFDHAILEQLSVHCQPDPRWVEGAEHAISALGDQVWSLCLIHLDPDPEAGLASASIIIKNLVAPEGPNPPCFGITASVDEIVGPLQSASGLDSIVYFPCQAQVWKPWLSDPVFFNPDDLIDRMMGNELLAKRVVEVFLEDAPRQLMALHNALSRQDNESSSRIAHSLRGAAANAGGDSLISLATGIETSSGLGQFDEVQKMLPKLEKQFARLRPVLEQFCR